MDESHSESLETSVLYRVSHALSHCVPCTFGSSCRERGRGKIESERENESILRAHMFLFASIRHFHMYISDSRHSTLLTFTIYHCFSVQHPHSKTPYTKKKTEEKNRRENSHSNLKADADAFGCWYLKISAFRAYVANTNTHTHTCI